MTWAAARKAIYLPIIVVLVAVVGAGVLVWADGSPGRLLPAALTVIVLSLIPGVVGRALLKDLFASRALIQRRDYEKALAAARRFLEGLAARPWIRHAIWTHYGFYSLSVGAIAHNNAGAALIELGRFEEAEEELAAARRLDSSYALPVFNLAVLARLRGHEIESEELAQEAARLGYAGGRVDRVIAAVGDAYARLASGE
jgi:tetratricopeptide (TPR) repeat protein